MLSGQYAGSEHKDTVNSIAATIAVVPVTGNV
ncbi:MAG: hypothetical protein JWQ09_5988 [Segetibacter sp.]|nr:hypothetical protein [Segetibacter sp.]